MSQVINANIINPEPVVIEIDDKTIEIKKIPFGLSFQFYDLIPLINKAEKDARFTEEDIDLLENMVTKILQCGDKSITKEWVHDNVSLGVFKLIMPPIMKMIYEDATKKNEEEEVSPEST